MLTGLKACVCAMFSHSSILSLLKVSREGIYYWCIVDLCMCVWV